MPGRSKKEAMRHNRIVLVSVLSAFGFRPRKPKQQQTTNKRRRPKSRMKKPWMEMEVKMRDGKSRVHHASCGKMSTTSDDEREGMREGTCEGREGSP